MIDSNTPLDEIMKLCNNMDDLRELLKQIEPRENYFENMAISDSLLNKAKIFALSNPNITTADIQREFSIDYPKAAKLFKIRQNKNF